MFKLAKHSDGKYENETLNSNFYSKTHLCVHKLLSDLSGPWNPCRFYRYGDTVLDLLRNSHPVAYKKKKKLFKKWSQY